MTRPRPPRRHAFTLIELLVVMVIIGILVAIALPVYTQFTIKARQTQTLNNMRQMGAAFLLYAGDNNYQLPNRESNTTPNTPKWPGLLYPYVQNLQTYIAPIPDWSGKQATQAQLLSMVPTLNNTPNPSYQATNNYSDYIANGYNDLGALNNPTIIPRLNNISTPSQVILLGVELQGKNNFYMDFLENDNNTVLDRTPWSNGSIYVFCDGSSRFLQYNSAAAKNAQPTTGGSYTDWLWLFDKSDTGVIQ